MIAITSARVPDGHAVISAATTHSQGASMFPTSPLSGSITIPSEATFWMPKPEDIDEEGIGSLIRGTWLIKDVPVREARQLGQEERRIAEVLGNLAAAAEDFDRLAHAVEDGYDPDNPDGRYALTFHRTDSARRLPIGRRNSRARLPRNRSRGSGLRACYRAPQLRPQAVEGIRVITPGPTSPSYCSLRRSTAPEHCNHSPKPPTADSVSTPARPGLLAIQGRSILDTMALADAVLASRRTFVQPRQPRGSRPALRHGEERLL